jgi:hypothetical protein
MSSDRLTIFRDRCSGDSDWRLCRRGQTAVLQQGSITDQGAELPAAIVGRKSPPVTLVLPTTQVILRIMSLPLLDAEELAGAVDLQVDKLSPFPVEQVVYSYEILAKDEENTTILVAIAQRSSVASWGEVLRAGGAEIDRVDCTVLGIWQSLQTSQALDMDRRESLLFVDRDESVLITHEAGKLLSVSGLGAAEDWTDPSVCEDLSEELARLLMESDAEHGPGDNPCIRVVGVDGNAELEGLCHALTEALDVDVLPFNQTFPDVESGILQRCGKMDAGTAAPLNLIPSEWVDDTRSKGFRKKLLVMSGVLFGVWVILAAGGMSYMAWARSRLEYLKKAEIEWLRPANAVRSMRLQVRLIDRYRDRDDSALECLREISAIQPEGVDLLSFTYRKDEGIELVGEADSGALVLQFNQKLNDSSLFRDVRPGTRTRTRQGRHRFSFDLILGEGES